MKICIHQIVLLLLGASSQQILADHTSHTTMFRRRAQGGRVGGGRFGSADDGGDNGGDNNDGGDNGGDNNNDGGDNGDNNNNNNNNDGSQQQEEGDLGVRFSKFALINDPGASLTLEPEDYPMRGDLATMLKNDTNAVSVMTSDDPEVADSNTFDDYIRDVGGAPTFPNDDPNHEFWDDFGVVVQAQVDRRAGKNLTDVMIIPELWKTYNIDEIAENVHDEYPGLWQSLFLESLFAEGVALDYDVLPFRSRADFVGGLVRMSELNTWAIGNISPTNFLAKWSYGRPRPEEVAWLINNGDIPASAVPTNLRSTILGWNLTDATDFTAYEEGSPRHPSWPAMHSAASCASFWMSVVFDLTDAQYCEALLTDYIVSYARTVAGVHYPTDNIVGLNLGQEMLADLLVDHLVDRYDADEQAARDKVRSMRFDWNDFDPLTCEIASSSS